MSELIALLALPVGVAIVMMIFRPRRERYWRDNEAEEGEAYTDPTNLRT